jgi:hypothetical protein
VSGSEEGRARVKEEDRGGARIGGGEGAVGGKGEAGGLDCNHFHLEAPGEPREGWGGARINWAGAWGYGDANHRPAAMKLPAAG